MSQEVPVRVLQEQQREEQQQQQSWKKQRQQEQESKLTRRGRSVRSGRGGDSSDNGGVLWSNMFDSPIDRIMKTFFNNQYGGLNLFGDRDFDVDFDNKTTLSSLRFKCDIIEHDNYYDIQADLPGLDKNAINITFHDAKLGIEAKRENKREQVKGGEQGESFLQEINYGNLCRHYYLPKSRNVNVKNIKAKYENGVLEIFVPKATEEMSKNYCVQIE